MMIQSCAASMEAVAEQEDAGSGGCPICTRPAEEHRTEQEVVTDAAADAADYAAAQ